MPFNKCAKSRMERNNFQNWDLGIKNWKLLSFRDHH